MTQKPRRSWAVVASAALLATALPARAAVLRVCDDVEEPASLNPYQVFSEKTHTLIQQVLEGLVRFDPDGQLEPALAERWERKGPRMVRFHLRKGVRFHNDELFDARSVKFSLEQYVRPETRFPGLVFVRTIEQVEIRDDHTIDVITREPDGLLLNRLAAWIHIVPPDLYQAVGPEEFARRPVGTGPFQFDRWDRGDRITLTANPRYWMDGYPKVDRLVFKFVPWDQQVPQLLAGELDIVTELPGTMTTKVTASKHAHVIKKASFYTVAGSLNASRGPLANKKVREAVNLAINRANVIRYDVLGNAKILATLAMEGEEGYLGHLKPYAFDPAQARGLLREAGFAGGFKIRAAVKQQGERAWGVVAKNLERVGIRTETRLFTDAELTKVLNSDKNWDVVFGGCPDPMVHSYFIQSIFLHSRSPFSISLNPAYDRMLEDMLATVDPAKRRLKAEQLNRTIHEEFLVLPLYQRIKTYGLRRGVEFTPYVTGMPHLFAVTKLEKM